MHLKNKLTLNNGRQNYKVAIIHTILADSKEAQLTDSQIVNISIAQLGKLKTDMSKTEAAGDRARNVVEIGPNIINLTENIIQAKESKNNEKYENLKRNVTLISALFFPAAIIFFFLSPILIGIQKFREMEINKLRETLNGMRAELAEEVPNQETKVTILKDALGCDEQSASALALKNDGTISQFIVRIHILNKKQGDTQDTTELATAKNELKEYVENKLKGENAGNVAKMTIAIKDNKVIQNLNSPEAQGNVESFLNGTFSNALETLVEDSKTPYAFKRDYEESQCTFQIKDRGNDFGQKIPAETDSKKRFDAANNTISSIIGEEKAWEPILQVAATQTSLSAAFQQIKGDLLDLGTQIAWSDGSNLIPQLPGDLPPAKLEIIRDESGKITKVNVLVESKVNLVKSDTEEVVMDGAITTSLRYSITMGDDGKPVFSDFKFENKSNIEEMGEAGTSSEIGSNRGSPEVKPLEVKPEATLREATEKDLMESLDLYMEGKTPEQIQADLKKKGLNVTQDAINKHISTHLKTAKKSGKLDQVMQLYDLNLHLYDVEKKSYDEVYKAIAKELGLPAWLVQRHVADQVKAQEIKDVKANLSKINEQRNDGWTDAEIELDLHLPEGSIKRYFDQNPIDKMRASKENHISLSARIKS